MKFITDEELINITALVGALKDWSDTGTLVVSIEAVVTDSNGEVLGTVGITDGGEYGLILSRDEDD